MRGGGRALDECGMVRVNVCSLDVDQALGVVRRGPKAFAEKFRDDLDKLRMESRESLELLLKSSETMRTT